MEGAMFRCPARWAGVLPPVVRRLELAGETEGVWDVLALSRRGCREMGDRRVCCGVLLLPGDCAISGNIQAETVISWGLSARDTLTFSSLREPVLCIQRTLLRPDGSAVEPQEIPLPPLLFAPEELLPVLGLRLLLLPGGADALSQGGKWEECL